MASDQNQYHRAQQPYYAQNDRVQHASPVQSGRHDPAYETYPGGSQRDAGGGGRYLENQGYNGRDDLVYGVQAGGPQSNWHHPQHESSNQQWVPDAGYPGGNQYQYQSSSLNQQRPYPPTANTEQQSRIRTGHPHTGTGTFQFDIPSSGGHHNNGGVSGSKSSIEDRSKPGKFTQ